MYSRKMECTKNHWMNLGLSKLIMGLYSPWMLFYMYIFWPRICGGRTIYYILIHLLLAKSLLMLQNFGILQKCTVLFFASKIGWNMQSMIIQWMHWCRLFLQILHLAWIDRTNFPQNYYNWHYIWTPPLYHVELQKTTEWTKRPCNLGWGMFVKWAYNFPWRN